MMYKKTTVRMSMFLAALVFTAGCSGGKFEPRDYRKSHRIIVEEEVISLSLDTKDGSVDKNDSAKIKAYVNNYIKKGEGKVEIEAYFFEDEKKVARKRAFAVADELIKQGLRREEISVRPLPASNKENSESVMLNYKAYKANVPQCGHWGNWKQAYSWGNQHDDNFGCATQRNIGLMVANPRDLIKMRSKQGRSSARGIDVLGKYAAGAETASQSVVDAALTAGDD